MTFPCPNCGRLNRSSTETMSDTINRSYDCVCGCRYYTEQTDPMDEHIGSDGYGLVNNYLKYQSRPLKERTFDIYGQDSDIVQRNVPYSTARAVFPHAGRLGVREFDVKVDPKTDSLLTIQRVSNRKSTPCNPENDSQLVDYFETENGIMNVYRVNNRKHSRWY